MKLLSDRVKVEVLPEKTKFSKTGLLMVANPNTGFMENYFRGKVVSTGNGRNINGKIVPMTVKEGDIVIYPISDCKVYKEEKKSHHIIYETDIYAVLEEDE